MAGKITFHGRKKLSTLQKEFTAEFPYLGIMFYSEEEHEKSKRRQRIHSLSGDLSLASVRTRNSGEDLSLHGRTLVRTLEQNMLKHFGLFVQVCFGQGKDCHSYYSTDIADGISLTRLNKKVAAEYEPYRY